MKRPRSQSFFRQAGREVAEGVYTSVIKPFLILVGGGAACGAFITYLGLGAILPGAIGGAVLGGIVFFIYLWFQSL